MKHKKALVLVFALALVLSIGLITAFASASASEKNNISDAQLSTVNSLDLISEEAIETGSDEQPNNNVSASQYPNSSIEEAGAENNNEGTEKGKSTTPVAKGVTSNNDNDVNVADNERTDTPATEENYTGGVTVSSEIIIEGDAQEAAEIASNIEITDVLALRSFLDGLDYQSYTCDGLPEYNILFDDGVTYYINLTSRWVWKGNDQEANLSESLLAELQTLLGIE